MNVFDEDKVRTYINNLCESKSYKNRANDRTPYEVFEHFIYNRRLVVLNEKSYPEHILSIMQSHTDYNVCKDLSEVEYIIAAQRSELTDILDLI